jgi:hypothetical protein
MSKKGSDKNKGKGKETGAEKPKDAGKDDAADYGKKMQEKLAARKDKFRKRR